MLDFPDDQRNEQKCEVTHGVMGHLDPQQPPVKRKPFSSILTHPFLQKVELVLPFEVYEMIKDGIFNPYSNPTYSRVILPLKSLLEGEFFNQYIKIGNIMMLSEGNSGTDNVYSLREGLLTLHLDRESYQRAGLEGKPDGVKGKRGGKPRWVVEINLRLPSMLHGKKGFDRIVYAFKNVLNTPVTWLFHDLNATVSTSDFLDSHFPDRKVSTPVTTEKFSTNIPSLQPPANADLLDRGEFEDYSVEIHEWLALFLLQSPRISKDDKIDLLLSRYSIPSGSIMTANLVKVTWQGFLSPMWAHKTFVQLILAVPQDRWFAYAVDGFSEGWRNECRSSTILKIPDVPNEYMLWDIA